MQMATANGHHINIEIGAMQSLTLQNMHHFAHISNGCTCTVYTFEEQNETHTIENLFQILSIALLTH